MEKLPYYIKLIFSLKNYEVRFGKNRFQVSFQSKYKPFCRINIISWLFLVPSWFCRSPLRGTLSLVKSGGGDVADGGENVACEGFRGSFLRLCTVRTKQVRIYLIFTIAAASTAAKFVGFWSFFFDCDICGACMLFLQITKWWNNCGIINFAFFKDCSNLFWIKFIKK